MCAIQAAVCDRFGITLAELLSHRRTAPLVRARHAAYWLGRLAGYSFPELGRAFGRHHSTVIEGVSHVRRIVAADPDYGETLAALADATVCAPPHTLAL